MAGDRRRTGRRHWPRRVVLVAAAVAAVAVVGPSVVPSDTPGGPTRAAAAAERLAVTARSTPMDVVRPGQYLYQVTIDHNVMEGNISPLETTTRIESWRAPNGDLYRRDTVYGGDVDTYFFQAREPHFSTPTPELLAELPREPDALLEYLDPRVQGSSSHQEALFVALSDMLRYGLIEPELRAAMIRAIGLLPDIAVDETAVDAEGRSGVALIWTRPSGVSDQTVIFDPDTARILEERNEAEYDEPIPDGQPTSRYLSYSSTIVERDVVDSVPSDVRDTAERS